MKAETAAGRTRLSGQSTVEFMLMIPVIFAMLFFVIEMGLYFSAVHYANYATFVTARSQAANFGDGAKSSSSRTATDIASLVLTGSAFRNNFTATSESSEGVSNAGISIALKHWQTNFPYLSALLPNMPFTINVYLGPNEFIYEERARSSDVNGCVDNDVSSSSC